MAKKIITPKKKKEIKLKPAVREKYAEAIGRRKTAVARVRIWPSNSKQEVTVNDKNFSDYFTGKEMQDTLTEPLNKAGLKFYKISIKVSGGGLKAQVFASRHGLSRAMVLSYPESKTTLKTLGFLTRDSRMKERKKAGLKGARRAPQWSKR